MDGELTDGSIFIHSPNYAYGLWAAWQIQDMLDRFRLLAVQGMPWYLSREAGGGGGGGGWGDGSLGIPAGPLTQTLSKWEMTDEWMVLLLLTPESCRM